MRTTRLHRWTMLALVAPVLLLAACGDSNSTTPTPVPTPTPISVSGTWSMTANTTFKFTLTLAQVGAVITGSMHPTSPTGADTPIDGSFDGTNIVFTRHLPTGSTQVYTGIVSSAGSALSGTFTQGGSTKTYPWSASR